VTRGQLVPYTITLKNTLGVDLQNLSVVDNFPLGFKYVAGSARMDGAEARAGDEQASADLEHSSTHQQIESHHRFPDDRRFRFRG
jgi:uncharacterized repeat protein (TIGR01451 family)